MRRLLHRPRALFALDAAGAALSAFLLGVVLRRWETSVGMPGEVLLFLAALPAGFLAYDVACLMTRWADRGQALRGIALLNLGYCVVSVACLCLHRDSLTRLGWAYFVGEVAIVLALASWEWRVADVASSGKHDA